MDMRTWNFKKDFFGTLILWIVYLSVIPASLQYHNAQIRRVTNLCLIFQLPDWATSTRNINNKTWLLLNTGWTPNACKVQSCFEKYAYCPSSVVAQVRAMATALVTGTARPPHPPHSLAPPHRLCPCRQVVMQVGLTMRRQLMHQTQLAMRRL